MNRITPHLWFDREAKEAAAFYVSLFPNSRVVASRIIKDTPSGDVEAVDFELDGQVFGAISAGPEFQLNPSVSFLVHCASAAEVDTYWNALADGGTALMPLDEYPFSKRFGWIQDRFGITWQLMLQDGAQPKPRIAPYLLFSGQAAPALPSQPEDWQGRRRRTLLHRCISSFRPSRGKRYLLCTALW